ncbi:hypothetical protein B0I37DRAFT_446797 [Chaetomium sp. MPI-CAGE-AT-0009]|nr:hypothetical protein B0I37DRAFT_446797 [Chaetomium sp. MPI-CAGE-AT-0009]
MEPTNVAISAELPPQVTEEHLAVLPNLENLHLLRKNPDQMASALRRRLNVLKMASHALADDIHLFVDNGLVESRRPTTINFVRAAHYYVYCLILHSFYYIKGMEFVASKSYPDLEVLIGHTSKAVNQVKASLEGLNDKIKKAGWDLDMQGFISPTSVPTAPPFQLLFQALLERKKVMETLYASQDDADLLRNIRLLFPGVGVEFGEAKSTKPSKIGDGRPTVVFVSIYHGENAEKDILFGCNTPNWRGFPAIEKIAKTMRSARLSDFRPRGDPAFRALRTFEEGFREAGAMEQELVEQGLVQGAVEAAWRATLQGRREVSNPVRIARKAGRRAALRSTRKAANLLQKSRRAAKVMQEARKAADRLKTAVEASREAFLQRVRNAARAAMRNDDKFLGGTHEVGMAFDAPRWTYKAACYLCASTMEYRDPMAGTGGDREACFTTFD